MGPRMFPVPVEWLTTAASDPRVLSGPAPRFLHVSLRAAQSSKAPVATASPPSSARPCLLPGRVAETRDVVP